VHRTFYKGEMEL